MQEKEILKKVIDAALGRESADLCVKNAKVVDVYNKEVFESDVYVTAGRFAGFGDRNFPKAKKTVDASGLYMMPGFIDSHLHIESSHLKPSEYAKLVVACGTTTVVADPHEICNVCGVDGLDFMLSDSENAPVSIFFQFPSCVPCTPFENAGAVLKAKEIASRINHKRILGLGELMDYVSVNNADSDVLDKIVTCKEAGKIIDGHSPGIGGTVLDSYSSTGVKNDHECATGEDLKARVRRGMYVLLRQGTVCHDLVNLIKGVTDRNLSRILMCTDDCQAKTIMEIGHIDNNVRMAIKEGIDPISAICMATCNAAECFGLKDRGAIAPGYKADFILSKTLDQNLRAESVYTDGLLRAEHGKCIVEFAGCADKMTSVTGRMNVKNLKKEVFALKLKSDKVRVLKVTPGSVVTAAESAVVSRDSAGCWVRNDDDIVKIAVLERHKAKGTVGVGLIKDFGLRGGAVATTVAHDSHNLIVAGDNDEDMFAAARELVKIGGGMAVAKGGKVLCSVQHEIAGLMTSDDGPSTAARLAEIQKIARDELSIPEGLDPFMTLCFMSLIVIPELKITDQGLFDVGQFKFVPIEIG